jgi:hypothetical protein
MGLGAVQVATPQNHKYLNIIMPNSWKEK